MVWPGAGAGRCFFDHERDKKMKFAGISAVFLALTLSNGNVMAIATGKIEFAGGTKGKVTFDAKLHADAGFKCADCHSKPKLFEMKKGTAKLTMAAMKEGKFCGTCHAHSVNSSSECVFCHKK
jgi:c(7)-type cytochrome triheme protein